MFGLSSFFLFTVAYYLHKEQHVKPEVNAGPNDGLGKWPNTSPRAYLLKRLRKKPREKERLSFGSHEPLIMSSKALIHYSRNVKKGKKKKEENVAFIVALSSISLTMD